MENIINVTENNTTKPTFEVGMFVRAKYDCQIKNEKILSSGEIYEILEVSDKKVLVSGDSGKNRWVSTWGLTIVDNSDFADLWAI